MKLLLIGMDGSAFREGTYFRKRLFAYAEKCESVTALIATNDPAAKTFGKGNLLVVPVKSAWKPWGLLKMIGGGIREVEKLKKSSGQAGAGDNRIVISSQDAFFLGFASWIVARMTGVGLHMQVHVEFFSKFYRAEGFKNNFQSKLANFLLLKADAIRPVSGKIAKYCVEHLRISPEKIDVIPLLIDAEKIRNSPIRTDLHKTYPQFKKIILMACRLTKQKNIPLAMEVLNDLPQDVGLVLVGKGEEEPAIRAIIARLRLERRVIILPWSDDVASLMKTADVFLISSDYEGYVMTSMESSVAGLPIVMTDVGGAGEFVENGVNGIVTAVGDRAELVAGVQKILNDPTVRQKLIAGASQKSAALPTYDSYIMAMIASWKKAAKSKMSGFQK